MELGPYAGLMLSGNKLYGTTLYGGANGNGTVFALNTNGTGFTNLYSFTALDAVTSTTNSDGSNPRAGLILSGDTLYGTTFYGGSSSNGTVFAVNTDGTGFRHLHTFTGGSDGGHSRGSRRGAWNFPDHSQTVLDLRLRLAIPGNPGATTIMSA